jgi:hypothetical protein
MHAHRAFTVAGQRRNFNRTSSLSIPGHTMSARRELPGGIKGIQKE